MEKKITIEQFQGIMGKMPEGATPDIVKSSLEKKGYSVEQVKSGSNFFERLKLSFGDKEAEARRSAIEEQSGLKGKFDVGDIADVAGSVPSLLGFLGGSALGAPLGGVGAVGGAAAGSALGETVKQGIGGLLGVRKQFSPKEVAVEGALGGVAGGAGKVLGLAGKALTKPAEIALGTRGVKAVGTGLSEPALQKAVLSGEITTDTIAQNVGKLAQKAQTQSINKLASARKTITGNVKADSIINRLTSAVGKKAEAPLLENEKTIVDGLRKFLNQEIKGGTTISKKKLDTLIKRIDDGNFYRADMDNFSNSNKIVNSVREVLRDITVKGNPKLEKALRVASQKDIPFFEKLGKNIVGKRGELNVDILQNKINQLTRAIDDPNTRAESFKLLQELSKRIGAKGDFMKQLEVFARTRPLMKDYPGAVTSPFQTAGTLLERTIASGARGLGTVGQKLPQLPQGTIPNITKLSLFEALRAGKE